MIVRWRPTVNVKYFLSRLLSASPKKFRLLSLPDTTESLSNGPSWAPGKLAAPSLTHCFDATDAGA